MLSSGSSCCLKSLAGRRFFGECVGLNLPICRDVPRLPYPPPCAVGFFGEIALRFSLLLPFAPGRFTLRAVLPWERRLNSCDGTADGNMNRGAGSMESDGLPFEDSSEVEKPFCFPENWLLGGLSITGSNFRGNPCDNGVASYLFLRLRLSGIASGIMELSMIPLVPPPPLWRLKGLSIARLLLLVVVENMDDVEGATGGGMDGKNPKSVDVCASGES